MIERLQIRKRLRVPARDVVELALHLGRKAKVHQIRKIALQQPRHRHGHKGGERAHGSMFGRAPGSIGQSSYPSRVFKGMRMAGRMGFSRVTVKNLMVLKVVPESNLLIVKGSVPGAINGYLEIVKEG